MNTPWWQPPAWRRWTTCPTCHHPWLRVWAGLRLNEHLDWDGNRCPQTTVTEAQVTDEYDAAAVREWRLKAERNKYHRRKAARHE